MTLLSRTALFLLTLGCLGWAGNGAVTSAFPLEPTTEPRVAASAPVDTLRASTEPNTPLVLTLPAELSGRPVARYALLRGPALSGVAGRSFTWIPEGAQPGTHEALLRAARDDAPADTLVVRIDLAP